MLKHSKNVEEGIHSPSMLILRWGCVFICTSKGYFLCSHCSLQKKKDGLFPLLFQLLNFLMHLRGEPVGYSIGGMTVTNKTFVLSVSHFVFYFLVLWIVNCINRSSGRNLCDFVCAPFNNVRTLKFKALTDKCVFRCRQSNVRRLLAASDYWRLLFVSWGFLQSSTRSSVPHRIRKIEIDYRYYWFHYLIQ